MASVHIGMHKPWLWPGSIKKRVMTIHFTFALSLPYDIVGKITLRKTSIKEQSLQTTKFDNYYSLMSYAITEVLSGHALL